MPPKLEVRYVYAGAILHEDQLVHSYIRVKGSGLVKDDTLGDAVVYAKQLTKHRVGSVLKFTALDAEDNLVPSTGQFLQEWHDDAQVAMWTAMSQAVLASEEAYAKAMGNPNGLMKALDPLRASYSKLAARERAILLAQISAYIAGEE